MTLSRGEFIFIMNDDLQYSSYDFNKLLEKKEHNVVVADFPEKIISFQVIYYPYERLI